MRKNIVSVGFFLVQFCLVASAVASPSYASAQDTSGKSPSSNGSTSGSKETSGGLGFSIESEMLTYRALESNSEAVGCDIVAYLRGGLAKFPKQPSAEVCMVEGGTNSNARVVIFPFQETQFSDFQLWRADMEIMRELLMRGQSYCPEVAQGTQTLQGGIEIKERGTLTALGPAGSLSLLQSAIGMISSEASASPVLGTIEDDAFMDGVARELRGLNVPVIMPTTFLSYSLNPIDASRSPLLTILSRVYEVRECLEQKKNTSDARLLKLIDDIDAFLSALNGLKTAKSPAAVNVTQPSESSKPAAHGDAAAQGQARSEDQNQPAPVSPTHLMAILSADGLARKLGVDPETGLLKDGAPYHVLLLKALESGGTIERKSNILGTKIQYSGGSVGTYALFDMDGDLECSGNVYEFGGSVPSKKFQNGLPNYVPDPGKQFIFLRSSCQPR